MPTKRIDDNKIHQHLLLKKALAKNRSLTEIQQTVLKYDKLLEEVQSTQRKFDRARARITKRRRKVVPINS